METTRGRLVARRLVARIDCAVEYGDDQYFDHGDVRVVDSPIGRYREAEDVPLSRFGYRFSTDSIGAPHELIITYPDDRRRFMCIVDGTSYDLSTGVTTGFAQPASGSMQTLRQVFWPRWNDCSVTFMTWGHGEPAAAATIEVCELEGLPPAELPALVPVRPRGFGIQYEDPCGTGASEGAMNRDEWGSRVISYARHAGLDELAYPIVWYHGPHYPSQREPSDDFDVIVGRDRRQYVRWTVDPADWVDDLLTQTDAAGIRFRGVLTLLRLGSLMQRMNTDEEAVGAGAETINTVLSDGHVQAGTMDWTTTYNCRNYDALVEAHESVGVSQDFPYVYGEKTRQPYGFGPIFNCAHPVVADAIVGLAEEIATLYAGHTSFRGINFSLWAPAILWFGHIRAGYDDVTVGRFTEETGICVPGDAGDPNRFAQRYAYLTDRCRDAWIAWRCTVVRRLLQRMRDAMRRVRPDLDIVLDLWSEPFVPGVTGNGGPEHQIHARKPLVTLLREAGLDPADYRDEPGITLSLQLEGGGRDRTQGMDPDAPLEAFTMFRDHDFLDDATLGEVHALTRPRAFVFNAWHEAWGTHRWFSADPDDTQAAELATMSGKPADGIFRMNSEYPADGFWWDSQLRITPAFPAAPHFMEPHAHALAEFDALAMNRGGLFLEKAHTEELARFSRAYRSLPDQRFETVGVRTDPVAVRTLVADGRRYVYLVNRDYQPASVTLSLGNNSGNIADAATGEVLNAPRALDIALGAYELRTFVMGVEAEPRVEGMTIAAESVAELDQLARQALEALGAVETSGRTILGANRVRERIEHAQANGHTARLRRLLTCYVVRKAFELTEAVGEPRR